MKKVLRRQKILIRTDEPRNNWRYSVKQIIRTVTVYTSDYGYSATIKFNHNEHNVRRHNGFWYIVA